MARIKIKDLPKDLKVTREEMKTIMGGIYTIYGRPPAGPIGVLAKPPSGSGGPVGIISKPPGPGGPVFILSRPPQ